MIQTYEADYISPCTEGEFVTLSDYQALSELAIKAADWLESFGEDAPCRDRDAAISLAAELRVLAITS